MSDVATAPGNVTYPTRNFATLGPFIYVTQRFTPLRGLATLHVAMQIGLYHLRAQSREARRVVSEGIQCARIFPADCPHRMDFHAIPDRVPPDARTFQHIARFVDGTTKPLMI
jgi:hypothetical protein